MKQIGIRWSEELLDRIDHQRNGRSRSDYIRDAVEERLAQDEMPSSKGNPEIVEALRKAVGGKISSVAVSPEGVFASVSPSATSPEDCAHQNHGKVDGVTTCSDCGSTRPYFSWLPPE